MNLWEKLAANLGEQPAGPQAQPPLAMSGRRPAYEDPTFGQRLVNFGTALQGGQPRDFGGEAKRANQTFDFLIRHGMGEEDARAAISNPALLQTILPKIMGGGKVTDEQANYTFAKQNGYTGGFDDFLRLRRSQSPTQQTPDERAAIAQQYGVDPNSDAGRAYILTGRLPREDQQMLTATDKKAILEADDAVSVNQNAIAALNEAMGLSPKANQGWLAGTRAAMSNNLPDYAVPDFISSPESGQATTNLDNAVIGTALAQLKSVFGGNPTEGERKILLELQGSSSQPDNVRQDIYKRAIAMANRRLEFNKERAASLRGGTFYKPQGGGSQPAPSGNLGARVRAKNAEGQIIEWNGSEWVPAQ